MWVSVAGGTARYKVLVKLEISIKWEGCLGRLKPISGQKCESKRPLRRFHFGKPRDSLALILFFFFLFCVIDEEEENSETKDQIEGHCLLFIFRYACGPEFKQPDLWGWDPSSADSSLYRELRHLALRLEWACSCRRRSVRLSEAAASFLPVSQEELGTGRIVYILPAPLCQPLLQMLATPQWTEATAILTFQEFTFYFLRQTIHTIPKCNAT